MNTNWSRILLFSLLSFAPGFLEADLKDGFPVKESWGAIPPDQKAIRILTP